MSDRPIPSDVLRLQRSAAHIAQEARIKEAAPALLNVARDMLNLLWTVPIASEHHREVIARAARIVGNLDRGLPADHEGTAGH